MLRHRTSGQDKLENNQNSGKITSDELAPNMVRGWVLTSQRYREVLVQNGHCFQPQFSQEQTDAISAEIRELLKKGVVVECWHSKGQFILLIFVRPKKDYKLRIILNLKNLNQNVEYHHLRMETASCFGSGAKKNVGLLHWISKTPGSQYVWKNSPNNFWSLAGKEDLYTSSPLFPVNSLAVQDSSLKCWYLMWPTFIA